MSPETLKAISEKMSHAVRDHVEAALTARLSPLEARLTRLEATNEILRTENERLKGQLDLFQTDERRSDAPLRAVK